MSRYTVIYVGGPRDGLREWRDDSLRALECEEFKPAGGSLGIEPGDLVECVVQRHTYVKRPAGRDEHGHEVFVAIHEPMLLRG
jgi:hypothetical protein